MLIAVDNGTDLTELERLVSSNIKALREERGWTQSELARRLSERGVAGIYPMTIGRLEAESEDHRPIRFTELVALADIFGVPWRRITTTGSAADLWLDRARVAIAQAASALDAASEFAFEVGKARAEALELLADVPPREDDESPETVDEVSEATARLEQLAKRRYGPLIDRLADVAADRG